MPKLSEFKPEDISLHTEETPLDSKSDDGDFIDTLLGTAYGGAQGLTGGFLDEALAGIAAGGQKALEKTGLTKESPEYFSDLYDRYKKMIREKGEEYKEKTGGIETPLGTLGPSQVAEVAGSVFGPGKILKAASGLNLAGRLGAAGLTGALESYGRSEGETPLLDTGVGAVAGLVGGGAGEGASAILKKVGNALIDTQFGRQLLAVAEHAGLGKSIYGEKAGTESTEKSFQEAASQLAGKITSGITEADEMAKKAAQLATKSGQTLDTTAMKQLVDDLKEATDLKFLRKDVPLFSVLESAVSPEERLANQYTKQMLGESTQKQALNPIDTLRLMDELRDYAFSLKDDNAKRAINTLKDSLEEQFNKMISGSIPSLSEIGGYQTMKATQHRARALTEPFIQQTGRVLFPTPEQPVLSTMASSLPKSKLEQTVRQNIESILKSAGKPSSVGQISRADIRGIGKYVEDLNKVAGGVLPELKDELTGELSKKSALIGAKQSAFGQLGAAADIDVTPGILKKAAQSAVSSAFRGAEYLGKKPKIYNYARYLLAESDEKLFNFANQLKKDPNFSHYASAIEDALSTGRRDKLNPIMFALIQNPGTREIVKAFMPGETEE